MHAAGGERVAQALFGFIPSFVGAGTLFGAQREFDADVLEAELFVNFHHQLVEGAGFFGDLVFSTEDVGVVLHEAAHAHQAVQCAGRLVAVAGAEFGQAHGQVAVGTQAVVEDLHVAGAVHRFYGVVAFLGGGGEHIVFVVRPVAGFFPEGFVEDLRGFDFAVAGGIELAAHVLLDGLPQRPAARMPKYHAGGFVLQVEEVELFAEAAVVAFFGLFNTGNVGFELVFASPGGAVDALQHFVVAVAAPVGAGQLGELEVF